jgi:hypothetical protein
MYYAHRLADNPDEDAYPLRIDGAANWSPITNIDGALVGSLWRASIALPEVPCGHIIVPSFSMLGGDYQYQVALVDATTGQSNRLNPLLTAAENLVNWPEKCADLMAVSAQIDCWHSESELLDIGLVITVQSVQAPSNYILALSIREISLTTTFSATKSVLQDPPRAISQMSAEANLRNRICSPTSLAMVHASLTGKMAYAQIVDDCYDPATKAYGKWPLAVYAANTRNLVGAVESLASWESVAEILAKRWFIVCSIRFKKDTLTGAPLEQSAGHLVLLYGIDVSDPEQPTVLVMDPAGPTSGEVRRRYKLREFAQAWLDYRGGAYILNQATFST